MKLGADATFRNGLSVCVDWLSFTMPEIEDPIDVIELLGYSDVDFRASSGRYGYKSAYVCLLHDGLTILYDGNEGMGVHVDISGSAIASVLQSYYDSRLMISTPFGEMAYEAADLASSILSDLLNDILLVGKITRLDLAIDDIGAEYFALDEVEELLEIGACVTRFKEYRIQKSKSFGGKTSGNTVYLGSRSSACMIRIYDKKLEQNAKLKKSGEPLLEEEWVRWELELKDERAISAAKILCSGKPLGDVAIGILSNYVRFINLDNTRRSRCSTLEKWDTFISGVVGLKLYQAAEPKTIRDKKAWIWRQVARSLAAIVKADGGDMSFLYSVLVHGNDIMDKATQSMVDDYIEDLEHEERTA